MLPILFVHKKNRLTGVAGSALRLLRKAFRTANAIPGENSVKMVPRGDPPADFPPGATEHPPPPFGDNGVAALASLEYAEVPAPLTARTR